MASNAVPGVVGVGDSLEEAQADLKKGVDAVTGAPPRGKKPDAHGRR